MISVIITNYNNGGLLLEAVSSVLNQTYTNIELLIIDDHSTDDSIDILKEEFGNDKRMTIFELDENHGAGWARDFGLSHSHGEWVSFVDGDDWVYPNFYKHLITFAEVNKCDMCSCTIEIEDKRINPFQIPTIVENKQAMIDIFSTQLAPFLNNKIIKKKCFDGYGYCKRRYIEDTPTHIHCILNCDKIGYIPYVGYHYRQNQSSLTHTCSHTKTTIYYNLAVFEIYEAIVNAGYQSHINPGELARDLVLQGKYGMLDGNEIEENYKEEFAELNKFVDKYYID